MTATFTKMPDPMYGTAVCAMDVFYKKWGANLDKNTIDKWNWTEFKKRLSSKPADEKWFVVKSVDTLPAEDDSVPFVPNYICFASPANGTQQAPRFCMKAAIRSPTHDPEAFIPDDIIDMSTTHEWRPLKDDKTVFVLCGRNEKTDALVVGFGTTGGFGERVKRKEHEEESNELKRSKPDPESTPTPAFTFGGQAPSAAPAATPAFTFGGQAPDASATPAATPAFTFGGQAPEASAAPAATPAFTFGGQAPSAAPAATPAFTFGGQNPSAASTTPATGGFTFGAPAPAASTGGSDFFSNTSALSETLKHEVSDEPVFPVFWQENTIDDLREEIDSGAKIITQFTDPKTNEAIKVVLENDIEFLEAPEAKQTKSVRKILQKHVLKKSDAFKALLDKYQGDHIVVVPTPEEMERMTKEFAEKKKQLIEGDLAADITAICERCSSGVKELVTRIANERREKHKEVLDQLTTIGNDIKKGDMYDRASVTIHRFFPEKNSMGDACAFRPSKQINKSAGRADFCYPEEYVLVNTLLLHGKGK